MIYYIIFGVLWVLSVAVFMRFIAGAKKLSGRSLADPVSFEQSPN